MRYRGGPVRRAERTRARRPPLSVILGRLGECERAETIGVWSATRSRAAALVTPLLPEALHDTEGGLSFSFTQNVWRNKTRGTIQSRKVDMYAHNSISLNHVRHPNNIGQFHSIGAEEGFDLPGGGWNGQSWRRAYYICSGL